MKAIKTHTIRIVTYKRNGESRTTLQEGTLPELIGYFRYGLETGHSYQHEKGNKKINLEPKTIKSLISNLNNAKTNAAANGCPNVHYSLND